MTDYIYEVPTGLCGEDMCPEPDMDCWNCTIDFINETSLDECCECNSYLCAVCSFKRSVGHESKK